MWKTLVCWRTSWTRGVVGIGRGFSTEISVKILFDPRDLWIGLFWTKTGHGKITFYICLLPMLPIRIHWKKDWGGIFPSRGWLGQFGVS